jgi:prepilin-type N-terminal cleavage/methylation domain-containing protein
MKTTYNRNNKAFTLVELSIVLVIIGLIVGGVVGSRSLIQSAKVVELASNLNSYKIAFNNFELQYDALPGDMADAYEYWGDSCHTNSGYCNGNGDNKMEGSLEHFMVWKHLMLANLINGTYSGTAGTPNMIGGTNVPNAGFDGVVVSAGYRNTNFQTNKKNALLTGKLYPNGSDNKVGFLTPAQARTVDKKIDDGQPKTGLLIGDDWTSRCYDGDNYNLDNTAKECFLLLWLE